jgi:1-acyl-sn-glycerol-3-phosphate acyltransferase
LTASQLAAIAFLLLLLAVPPVLVVIGLARSNLNPVQCVLWSVAFVLCKFLWRTRWPGWLPLAEGQGAVVVCNHRSSVDPFFVQTSTNRKVHWLVAREFCEHPAFRWFLSSCEVIPVNRGGVDTAATKAAIRYVAEGGMIGMLPEGRINMTDEFMLPARPGAALIALRAKAVVLPCYIHGAPYRRYPWSPLFMPARVEVRFGQPVDLSDLFEREGDTDVVQTAMLRILRALADTAGRPDFQPQLAGRNWKPTQEDLNAAMDAADERAERG